MKFTIGMPVRLKPEARRLRNLRDEEFTIVELGGAGPETFMRVKGRDGREVPNWFRLRTEVLISAHRAATVSRASDNAAEVLANRAHQLVADSNGTLHFSDAVKRVAMDDPATVAKLESCMALANDVAVESQEPISLHRGESFSQLVERLARERHLEFREAARIASRAYPDLAQAYSRA